MAFSVLSIQTFHTFTIIGEVSSKSEINKPMTVMKKGQTLKDFVIHEIPRGVVKPVKTNKVKKLLISHFCEQWFGNPSSQNLKNVISSYEDVVFVTNWDEDEELYFQEEEGIDIIV